MARWQLLALLGLLFGCSRSASFRDVVEGRVAIADAERRAVATLLAQASRSPSDLELLRSTAERPKKAYWIRLFDGHVVGASLGGVVDAAPLADLPRLVEVKLDGNLSNLEGWGSHPDLTSVEIVSIDDSLRSVAGLQVGPALERLAIAGGDLVALDLGAASRLEYLSLRGVGLPSAIPLPASLRQLFVSHAELTDLELLAGMVALERLELISCGLHSLASLPPLPRLSALIVTGNPLAELDRLADHQAFPSLRTVGARETAVREAPPALVERISVNLSPPTDDPVEHWVETFLAARRRMSGQFVETLPQRSGSARGLKARVSSNSAMYRKPRLQYDGEIAELEGLVRISLSDIDPLMPFHGGGPLRLRARLEVGEGTVRLYLRERGDLRAQALALEGRGSEHDPSTPPRDPDERFDGYRAGEAAPGRPATVNGEAAILGSEAVVWLEATSSVTRGVRLRLDPA